jgi:hypothetical protein
LPAWLKGAAVNRWISISGTTHAGSAADPTSDGRSNDRIAFSNIALVGTQAVLAATGGHGDYFGNEVSSIELNEDSPSWTLRKARVELASVTLDTNPAWAGYNADGTPSSRHTYDSVHYSTTRSRLMLHRTRFSYPSANSKNASNGFNLATNTWDAAGTWADGYTAMCRDGSDNVWAIAGASLFKWTAATDTWASVASVAGYIYGTEFGPLCHDSLRDKLVLFKYGGGSGFDGPSIALCTFSMTGTQTFITLSAGSSSAAAQFVADQGSYATMDYDTVNDCFWYWSGMSNTNGVAYLYKLTPNATTVWDLSIQTLTGTAPVYIGPDASGVVTGRRVGAHARMKYVQALGGLVFMTAGSVPLQFVRTS